MKIQLRPEIQKFVDEQVKAGGYGSTEELLEAAIVRLMLNLMLNLRLISTRKRWLPWNEGKPKGIAARFGHGKT